MVHTGSERALTAPGPEALTPLQPEAACVPLDGPVLPDDDDRRNLAAARTLRAARFLLPGICDTCLVNLPLNDYVEHPSRRAGCER